MRTAILIIVSLVLISGTFGLYMHLQPTRDLAREIIPPRIASPGTQPAGNENGMGPGKGVWILQFDAKTGRLVSRFRADDYFPQKNGLIHCRNPEAEFFLTSGQRMKLIGTDGDFVMKDSPDLRKGFAGKTGPSGPPNRGRINNVIIKLYDDQLFDPTVVEDEKHVIITMTTNNIDFDNDTFLITTQEYSTPEGVTIAPDQVQVHMKGEYEFEGRGLTLRWNDRDGRLELLEIAHGESLTILHPSKTQIGPGHDRTASTTKTTLMDSPAVGRVEIANSGAISDVRATSDRTASGEVIAPTTRKASTRRSSKGKDPNATAEHTVYQANFFNDVHVTQGPDTFANADKLRLHFMLKSQAAEDADGEPRDSKSATTARSTASGNTSSQTPSGRVDETASRPSIIADGSIEASLNPLPPSTRSSKPTTRPGAEIPVKITWTGKLIVAPTTTPPPRPVSPGAALVELIGTTKEILVHRGASAAGQDASEIHSASLLYQTLDGSAFLTHSDAYPQVVLNRIPDPGVAATRPANTPMTQVVCESLDYRATDHTATLLGKGHAVVPMTPDSGKSAATAPTTQPIAPPVLDARWEKRAKLYFVPSAGDEMSIERATFDGDVDMLHPQLALKAQSLDLAFDPGPTTRSSATMPSPVDAADASPTTKPVRSSGATLRNMLAVDDVHCKLINAGGKIQNIDTDRLELQTARDDVGKMYPHKVYATGKVHAYDETQDLKAGRMDLTLRPALPKARSATSPSVPDSSTPVLSRADHPATAPAAGSVDTSAVELQQMNAHENVVVANREGSTAMSDDLRVDMDGEDPHVILSGTHLARVVDARHNTLTGPRILIDPHQQMAHVVGPGTLHAIRETPPGGKSPAPTDVIWSDKADVDGNANKIDVYGKVVTTSADADGTINTASSDHVRIDLQTAAPTTKPTKPTAVANAGAAGFDDSPHHHSSAGTQPSPLQMDLFKNKQPSAITLDNNAVVRSSLTAPNGDILRESELKAPLIFYAIAATGDLPAHSLRVPSAGQMLTRDNRDPVAKPTTKPSKGDDTELASSRGATAFQWSKELVYTEDTHLATMTGDVIVVHEGFDEKKELPVKLTADKVLAYFEPTEKKPSTRPTGPDKRPAADEPQALQLKRVVAYGHLVVTRGPGELEGQQLDYDPAKHQLVVHGTDRTPAVFSDPSLRSPLTAHTIWWDTVTWHTKATETAGRSVK